MPHRFSLACLLLLLAALPLRAQDVDAIAPITNVVAIQNARIVVAPGNVIETGTVVVRDGLIESVGAGTRVPYDAYVINGDSLTIYAAFISGLTSAGVPELERGAYREQSDSRSEPTPDRAGIQPQRDVRMMLDPSEASIKALRDAGFGAAHVVPRGRFLPGQSALIVLSGDTPSDLVIRGQTAQFAQFDGALGVYPSTPMGVMAVMRQYAREAARRKSIGDAYERGPNGNARAPFDPAHEAFFPVLDGTQPMLFHVDDANEIFRAVRLSQDLGLNLMLAGLKGGEMAVQALKTADVPLFLSMELPEEMKKDSTAADYVSGTRTPDYGGVEAERDNLLARKRAAIAKADALPATMRAAGLSFGFATEDIKTADLAKNLRRMIAAGLSEDAALAALTTDAATLLGVSDVLGSVERGKIANLIVSQGSPFAEKPDVRMMIVDGKVYEMEARKSSAKPDSSLNPVGSWALVVPTPQGEQSSTLTLTGSPTSLEGTVSSAQFTAPAEIDEARLNGDQLTVIFTAPQFGRLTFTGTLTADAYEGTIEIPNLGSFPFTGTRIPN